MDVNDIIGRTRASDDRNASISQRAMPIRPKKLGYDLINPLGERLRMSSFGQKVIDSNRSLSTERDAIDMTAAGKKFAANQGEANIYQIWPSDESLRSKFDAKSRVFQTSDINVASKNPRQMKIMMEDNERIQALLASKQRAQSVETIKNKKNVSEIFSHYIDDPASRQKPTLRNICKYLFFNFCLFQGRKIKQAFFFS